MIFHQNMIYLGELRMEIIPLFTKPCHEAFVHLQYVRNRIYLLLVSVDSYKVVKVY